MGQTFRQMGWEDREVKVKRDDLLGVLRKNREQHIKDYTTACAGYRAAALKKIDEIFSDLKSKINGLKDHRHRWPAIRTRRSANAREGLRPDHPHDGDVGR